MATDVAPVPGHGTPDAALPFPPEEYRRLVGPTDLDAFDNPTGAPVFAHLPPAAYASVLDFGCGCGRIARRMIQQEPRPARYLGLDRHAGMIEWCREHLSPRAPGFEFQHHDAFHERYNAAGAGSGVPFPVAERSVTLVVAWSVFTHLLEADAVHYVRETARVLADDGVALTTWFLFDKRGFPMMQAFQNALYINTVDPTNAVIFDVDWLREQVHAAGLVVTRVVPPAVRGFQWIVELQRAVPGRASQAFPDDVAPLGIVRAPLD
ncbi:MAG: class I SAM-dependent methyltransferase [Proteobacteria bacterium]|nr:class I SAM-dependent methyltransferase [Pseudomonadota bacterium]